jgi:hypothetical protein
MWLYGRDPNSNRDPTILQLRGPKLGGTAGSPVQAPARGVLGTKSQRLPADHGKAVGGPEIETDAPSTNFRRATLDGRVRSDVLDSPRAAQRMADLGWEAPQQGKNERVGGAADNHFKHRVHGYQPAQPDAGGAGQERQGNGAEGQAQARSCAHEGGGGGNGECYLGSNGRDRRTASVEARDERQ